MIQSFRDSRTRQPWKIGKDKKGKLAPRILSVTMRKLQMLDAAAALKDLRIPPANRLEALKGDRRGQHSIRINDQWRVCFRWTDHGPTDLEICDYHQEDR
ncbi:type II toxin-antitoxin system RelE/ParE family toxin [Nesterenkonia sp. F]|uniref:type II toxin-antitoxin system RelE/ParE family toxin n=1 Tax=Nesterenkonia sp. F TaxID=795955 RepID=UPI000255D5A5|nr:type II toxin-antitoxin system RelE/ParE family toxin [Nesterenkonia sp. F]